MPIDGKMSQNVFKRFEEIGLAFLNDMIQKVIDLSSIDLRRCQKIGNNDIPTINITFSTSLCKISTSIPL